MTSENSQPSCGGQLFVGVGSRLCRHRAFGEQNSQGLTTATQLSFGEVSVVNGI